MIFLMCINTSTTFPESLPACYRNILRSKEASGVWWHQRLGNPVLFNMLEDMEGQEGFGVRHVCVFSPEFLQRHSPKRNP